MEVAETPKTYAVRSVVDAETEKALKAEQNKIQEETGKRPSVSEVVAMWLTRCARQAAAA
ncbi:hypothetical protein [Hymenobacter pini]|uniref:hypothetical protein n=1 Tax=Hymenobacter pini TaxID=2880879 RepID=UPI000F684336|nr:hypothetical protein [Hymenobacter pini]